jgi:threonine/homoserine/homoserine lactone efflux protein
MSVAAWQGAARVVCQDAPMSHAVWAFLPFAALLAVTPGPATAMVIQSAARSGRSHAGRATLGNATGLAVWAGLSMVGVSALVAASQTAFTVLRVAGAGVLIVYGIRMLLAARANTAAPADRLGVRPRSAFRMGLVTALSNPKVALFYVSLLPQFVPDGHSPLPTTLALAAVQIGLSCAWYLLLASAVDRLRDGFAACRRAIQATAGAAMIAFALRTLAD